MNNTTRILSLSAILIAYPAFAENMNFTPKNDISLSGKITTVKTSKKFRNIKSCQALCASRTSCVAFTLNLSKGSCTILRNVSKESPNENAVSGLKI
jgi:hypothetical protein|tara:strand:+ start:81 stop:371 length:291 start_codon:yes stop_codon:yes gene_type:complete